MSENLPTSLTGPLRAWIDALPRVVPAEVAPEIVRDVVCRLSWLLHRTKHNERGHVSRGVARELDLLTAPVLEVSVAYPQHPQLRLNDTARLLVAAGLRNSVLEDAHQFMSQQGMRDSSRVAALGLGQVIRGRRGVSTFGQDPYAVLFERYPAARAALWAVADAFQLGRPAQLTWDPVPAEPDGLPAKTRLSIGHFAGGTLPDELHEFLTGSLTGPEAPRWLVPGFRSMSRNPISLARLLEELFAVDGTLVTANYVLTNGTLLARYPLLPPSATASFVGLLACPDGLVREHLQILQGMLKGMAEVDPAEVHQIPDVRA